MTPRGETPCPLHPQPHSGQGPRGVTLRPCVRLVRFHGLLALELRARPATRYDALAMTGLHLPRGSVHWGVEPRCLNRSDM